MLIFVFDWRCFYKSDSRRACAYIQPWRWIQAYSVRLCTLKLRHSAEAGWRKKRVIYINFWISELNLSARRFRSWLVYILSPRKTNMPSLAETAWRKRSEGSDCAWSFKGFAPPGDEPLTTFGSPWSSWTRLCAKHGAVWKALCKWGKHALNVSLKAARRVTAVQRVSDQSCW